MPIQMMIGGKIVYRILIFFTVLSLFTGCASIPKNRVWQNYNELHNNTYQLHVGDILVLNKDYSSIYGIYGHSSLIVNNDRVGEYPNLYVGYREYKFSDWILNNKHKKFMVLRYKKFDYDFETKFKKNIEKYKTETYFFSSKTNSKDFYCSKYIWYLFYITAKEMGDNLDIDSDGGFFVFPYDFIASNKLNQEILN